MASLRIIKGQNPGALLPLSGERITLGRNSDCQIVINLPAVSREHALIRLIDGRLWIEDLGSRNGTLVNNRDIKERTQLQANDQIKICDNIYEFIDPTKPPLPEGLRKTGSFADLPESDDDGGGGSTVEATLGTSGPGSRLLEAQPAEKLAMLVDLSAELTGTLDQETLLPRIVDSLFQVFKQADRGFIIFRDEATQQLMPRVVKSRRGSDDTVRFSRSIVNRCLDTANAFLSEDAGAEKGMDLSQSIADARIRSVMCVPLMSAAAAGGDRKAFGVIQLDTQDRFKRFNRDDLRLLLAVAGQAAIALENARMHESLVARASLERDLRLAHQVQLSFLPKHPPQTPGYEFYAFYEAAQEVGGDYYDFIPLPSGRLGVMLGDVAGKGVPAALLMSRFRSDARFCMLTEPDVALAIRRLNDLMQDASMLDRFVTLAAALVDPLSHQVSFVNAGQMPPLVYRSKTSTFEEAAPRETAGLPLGVTDGYPYEAVGLTLEPGDCVLVFSDGVTDANDKAGKEFQLDGIHAALGKGPWTPRAMGEHLVAAVKHHAAGCKQHDDISIVCFGRVS